MKKRIKVLLIILGFIVLIIGILVILVLKKIIPNPFLDTSDLVCSKEDEQVVWVENQNTVISFDKWGYSKQLDEKTIYTFESEEVAKQYFNSAKESLSGGSVVLKLEKNNVIFNIGKRKMSEIEKKTKKDIKLKYEGIGYECN